MKLSRIVVNEPSVKHSFTFKKSTTDMLEIYRKEYSKASGADVKLKDLVEQMVLDFMSEDKSFQKKLRTLAGQQEAVPAGATPTRAEQGDRADASDASPLI